MPELKVNFDPIDINRAVSEAIVNSLLGETLIKMVNSYVEGILKEYNHPVKRVIEEEVLRITKEITTQKIKDIEDKIRVRVTSQMIDELINSALSRIKIY